MTRACMALALISCCAAQTGPVYTADSIVNASNFTPGPFAPNSVLTLFGTGLAFSSRGLAEDDIRAGLLPSQLANVQVFVDNYPVPLFYVSETQINFLVPSNQKSGEVKVRVFRQGLIGPEVAIALADAAPALFETGGSFAVATHADASLVSADSPAQPNEMVVVYGTGFGKTVPNPAIGEIPKTAAQLLHLAELTVYLDGSPVDAARIKYAGLTPESAGLYQINLELPANVGTDPEIRVEIAGRSSGAGVKLAVR